MNLSLQEEACEIMMPELQGRALFSRGSELQHLRHQHALNIPSYGSGFMAARRAGFLPAPKDRASARDTR